MRIAIIDAGTNSFHLLIVEVDATGISRRVEKLRRQVRLGEGGLSTNTIEPTAYARGLAAMREFQSVAQKMSCEFIYAAATSAVREASNGADFCRDVKAQTDIHLHVLSGTDEARLIYLGARLDLDLSHGPIILFDLGGGSTEFIYVKAADEPITASLAIGHIRAAEMLASPALSPTEAAAQLRAHTAKAVAQLPKIMRRATPVTVIATGGTARTLARMATAKQQQLPTHDQGLILSQSDLNTLVGLSARELRSAKGVDLRRVDTLHPGAILLAEILRGLQQERLITSDRSLRDGLLAAWIAQHRPELTLQDTCPDPRQRSVLRARQRFCPDPTHADHVAHLAGQLFDQLGGLHQASTEDRDLLCLGAVLHDIGHHIAGRGHAKHGMYLLQHTRMYGFVAPTIAQLAVLVRYHSRTMPKLRHPEFAALSPPAQAKIRLLAGILRLADALDRTHNQVISDIKSVQITDTTVTIFAGAKDSAEIERWAFQQRAPLLAEVLGRSVVLQLLSADHV